MDVFSSISNQIDVKGSYLIVYITFQIIIIITITNYKKKILKINEIRIFYLKISLSPR